MSGTSGLADVQGIPGFWQAVRKARSRCLVLDYDGTLAPFVSDRMKAFPLEGVIDLLVEIRDQTETYIAFMTGRPVDELLALAGDLRIPVSGSQGNEFRYPDGTFDVHEPTARQAERLDRAEDEARKRCRAGRIERKIASVALHTRGLDPEVAAHEEDEACDVWSADAADYDVECRHFKGGVEMRLKGIDKGTALRTLLRDRPDDGLCVYIGDDETDEDAFRVVRERGYGIRVGPPSASTAARGRLEDPVAVRGFLRSWLQVTRNERT
jgi:trehalose-phosphatase